MLLGRLHDEIEALNTRDLDALGDVELSDLVFEMQAEASLFAAAQARVLARGDARKVWADDGSKAAGARLARDADMCRGRANAVLHRARKLASMPLVAQALADGTLSIDIVDLLVAVNLPRRAGLFARDEAMLIDACWHQHSERAVRQVLDRWAQNADAALDHDPAKREREGRYFNADRTFAGIFDLRGRLDRVEGTVFANEHARLEHEMFLADWADARAEFGENCGIDKLARTPGQRRADALIEMARRSATRPASGVTPRPLISVVVGYETFKHMLLELADGTPPVPRPPAPVVGRGRHRTHRVRLAVGGDRCRGAGTVLHRRVAARHPDPGPALPVPRLRRARRPVRSRPHHPLQPRR